MNEIELNINFKNKSISKSNIFLTSGDYNSTKLVFKFDFADGEKYFELKNPSGKVVLYSKIENDEVILVGKTKDGKNASLFKEPGDYIFEISLYNGDSKLTSAYGTIIAEKEQVIIDGTTAEPYLPALENLLNNVKDALNKTENINITVSKDENKTIIEMTNKDGSKSKVEILDGTDGKTGEQGPIGPEGPQGTPGINGKDGAPGKDGINGTNGEDGFSPTISTEPLENGTKVTIIDKEGSKEFDVLNGENGKDGESHMAYIDLSTDIENPTEITDFSSKSGIYVAKNKGILGIGGSPLTILAEGMFFKVYNLKEFYKLIGTELPENENVITIVVPNVGGDSDNILVKRGIEDWETDIVTLNSYNVGDYVKVDTDNLLDKKKNISSTYGIKTQGEYLATVQATNTEIDSATNEYHLITPKNVSYAVEKKGSSYFANKKEFEQLKTDTDTLISEIETILDTVVNVDE